jgi:transcriptional regulator with XRE-family HTH domain
MDRKEFGQLVVALRKEHIDEEGKQWTQDKLAQVAQLAPEIVGNIERGRRSNLKPEIVMQLAEALNLTSVERRELLLAAQMVSEQPVAHEDNDENAQAVLTRLVQQVEHTLLPAYLLDVYCDILACNNAALSLLGLTPKVLQDRTHAPVAAANLMRVIFAPEWQQQAAMGEYWLRYAQYHMALFKQLTLRYRMRPYFTHLIAELRQWPLFRRYWFQFYNETHDPTLQVANLRRYSHLWGDVHYITPSLTAHTSQGSLVLMVAVPADATTAHVFAEMGRQTPRQAHQFSSWPDKDMPEDLERSTVA